MRIRCIISVVPLKSSIWMDMGLRVKGHCDWVIVGRPRVFNMGPGGDIMLQNWSHSALGVI